MSQRLYRLYVAAQSDKEAMEALMEPFAGQIASYGRRLRSEDAAQELRLFLMEMVRGRRLDGLRDRSDACVLSYLSKSLKNQRYKVLKDLPDAVPLPPELSYDDAADDRLICREALGALSKEERRLIFSLFYEGISIRELAARRHVSVRAVYQLKRRVIRKLRRFLGEAE